MLEIEPTNMRETTASFLTAEYQQFAAAFLANEESGERRVSIFLTIASAAAAAIGIAADQSFVDKESLKAGAALVLGSLALIGLATLLRIVKRNVVSDEYKAAMDTIRAVFRDSDPRLQRYNPFIQGRRPGLDSGPGRKLWGILPVGLVLLVAAVNSALLAGVLVAVGKLDIRQPSEAGLVVATLFGALVIQLFLADEAERSLKQDTSAYKIGSPDLDEVLRRGGMHQVDP